MCDRFRMKAKANVSRTESKLDISERVTSDLIDEKAEIEQQFDEAITKAESLRRELLAANKANMLLNQK